MGAFTFRVDHHIADVEKSLGKLERNLKSKVIVQSVNKTATTVRSRAIKRISKDTGIKQKLIRAQVKLVKARRGTKKARGRYFATVDASDSKAINLIDFVQPSKRRPNYFNARVGKGYRKPGVVARIGGKSRTYRGSFIGRNSRGEMRVWRRNSRSDSRRITLVSGPSVKASFRQVEMHRYMREVVRERFPLEFERAARFALEKFRRG